MQTPFQILGVPENASDKEIKNMYRKLALQHHPDKGGDSNKFKAISTAYDQIKNEDARGKYFGSAMPGININTGNVHNINDIFDHVFRVQTTVRTIITIDIEDLASNNTKIIQIRNGISAEILIPPINDGESIKYPQPNGLDLIVVFRIRPSTIWKRNAIANTYNLDLIREYTLDFWDFIIGTTLKVETIFKQTLNVVIPPMTEPGSNLRLKGHGLKHIKTGDMYVHLQAKLPNIIPESILNGIKLIKH